MSRVNLETTGDESVSALLICHDANKIVKLSVFTIVKTICQKIWETPLRKNAKRSLPVDVHRSKTSLLLKLPNKLQGHPKTISS